MHAYLMIVVAALAVAPGCEALKQATCLDRVPVNCYRPRRNPYTEHHEFILAVCETACRDSAAAKQPLWVPGEAPYGEAPCK